MFILPQELAEEMGTNKRRTKNSPYPFNKTIPQRTSKTAHFYGKSHRDCNAKQHTLQRKSIAIAAATHDHVATLCRL
jgi:hypothetical protein